MRVSKGKLPKANTLINAKRESSPIAIEDRVNSSMQTFDSTAPGDATSNGNQFMKRTQGPASTSELPAANAVNMYATYNSSSPIQIQRPSTEQNTYKPNKTRKMLIEAQSHKSHHKAELNKTFMHKRESISKPILFYPTFDFTKPSRNRLGQGPARNTGGPGPASRYNQSNAGGETRWTLPSKTTPRSSYWPS